jgi:hypothetical protein
MSHLPTHWFTLLQISHFCNNASYWWTEAYVTEKMTPHTMEQGPIREADSRWAGNDTVQCYMRDSVGIR